VSSLGYVRLVIIIPLHYGLFFYVEQELQTSCLVKLNIMWMEVHQQGQ